MLLSELASATAYEKRMGEDTPVASLQYNSRKVGKGDVFFCIVGTFALNNSVNDIFLMMIFGLIAFFLIKLDFPTPPIILGLILGNTLEKNLQRALLVSKGDFSIFFTRPISLALLLIAFGSVFLPVILRKINAARETRRAEKNAR